MRMCIRVCVEQQHFLVHAPLTLCQNGEFMQHVFCSSADKQTITKTMLQLNRQLLQNQHFSYCCHFLLLYFLVLLAFWRVTITLLFPYFCCCYSSRCFIVGIILSDVLMLSTLLLLFLHYVTVTMPLSIIMLFVHRNCINPLQIDRNYC